MLMWMILCSKYLLVGKEWLSLGQYFLNEWVTPQAAQAFEKFQHGLFVKLCLKQTKQIRSCLLETMDTFKYEFRIQIFMLLLQYRLIYS